MRKYLVTKLNVLNKQREIFVGTSREAAVRFMNAEKSSFDWGLSTTSVSLFREITPGSDDWILLEAHDFRRSSRGTISCSSVIVEESVVRQRENTWINSSEAK